MTMRSRPSSPFWYHAFVGAVLLFAIAGSFVNVFISETLLVNHSNTHSLVALQNDAGQWRRRIVEDDTESGGGTKETSQEITQSTNTNRTLVVVIGNLRGGESAWESLYRHVLDINSADLALVIGEVPSTNRTSSMYHRAKYLYEFPEFEDCADAIDLINGSDWRQSVLPLSQDPHGLFGGVKGRHGSGAVIFMARWFVSQFLQQHNLLKIYDRFVLTRSDHYYVCPYDMRVLDPNYIHVPVGEDWHGISDRHAIVSTQYVLRMLNMFPPLVYKTSHLLKGETLRRINPEGFIKARWKEEGIWKLVRRHDRVMFTCAVDGDTTRWQRHSSTLNAEFNVYIKYFHEYSAATCNCGGRRWNEPNKTCGNL